MGGKGAKGRGALGLRGLGFGLVRGGGRFWNKLVTLHFRVLVQGLGLKVGLL